MTAPLVPRAFDLRVAFRTNSFEELLEEVVEKMGSINGITASETLISYNLPGSSDGLDPTQADH